MNNITETHGSAFGLCEAEHSSLMKRKAVISSEEGKREWAATGKAMMGNSNEHCMMINNLFSFSRQSDMDMQPTITFSKMQLLIPLVACFLLLLHMQIQIYILHYSKNMNTLHLIYCEIDLIASMLRIS